jgi:F-type H+-transporting ATPase subunit delta
VTLAKRYAEGFLEYAASVIGFDSALKELSVLKTVFDENPDFMSFLGNPAIGYPDKCAAIDNTLGKYFSPETCAFVKLLLRKGRIGSFIAIEEYARFKYEHGEEVPAALTSAYPLDAGMVKAIEEELEEAFKKKLHMELEIDRSLLGGVRVAIGNIIIDGSIRKRLDDMRDKLMALRMN